MPDLFDNVILCRQCGKEMQKESILRNGIALRTAFCEKCGKKEYHPLDLARLREFQQLRQRPFRVKLRMVGNSYAVSIPREIIEFFEDANKLTEEVEMHFAEFDKLMLSFHQRTFLRTHEKQSFPARRKENFPRERFIKNSQKSEEKDLKKKSLKEERGK